MAGISSRALKSDYAENMYKFNGIEFNNELDLNQYDAFYRNYNPQIGRWFQIDPKPSDFESPYVAMGNNPILRNDFLGDTSIFYNAAGEQIHRIDDGSEKNSYTVIPEDRQKGFELIVNNSGVRDLYTDAEGNFDAAAYAAGVRAVGITYDYQDYFAYYDQHSKDNYTGTYYQPIDGKGPLINEHMSGTEVVDGHMKIIPGTDNRGTPFSSESIGEKDGRIHTHGSEGRRFLTNAAGSISGIARSEKGAAALIDKENPGFGDVYQNYQVPGSGKLAIVVNKTHVYLYTQGKVLISISRKGVGSKNSNEVK